MQLSELKYALRSIRKTGGSSFISIFVLAIGIGACTAIFSVVEAVLLNPPPYPQPDHVFLIWGKPPQDLKLGYNEFQVHGIQFNFLNSHRRGFEFISAFKPDQLNLTVRSSSERLDGIRASADFFRVLGIQPVLGRGFSRDDDQPGRDREVVLSYGLWKRYFSRDAQIVGKEISLNSEKYTVIGVMPEKFAFPRGGEMPKSFEMPAEPKIWVPLALQPQPRGPSELVLVARTSLNVSRLQAIGELSQDTRAIEDWDPRWKRWSNFQLVPLSEQLSGDLRPKILLLFGAVIMVLLITCGNVANLFLAKSMGRAKEIGVRVALGASRREIVQQFLVEGALLGVAGSLLGLGFAALVIKVLQTMNFSLVPRLQEAALDLRAVGFSIIVALATSVLFGIFPALEMSKTDCLEVLRTKEQKHSGSTTQLFRNGLLVGEVALTVTLVIVASMLVRSFVNLLNVNPGFSTRNLLTMELTLPPSKYRTADDITRMYTRLCDRLSQVPGIEFASLGKALPMSGDQESTVYYVNGRPVDPNNYPFAQYTMAAPDYFRTMGVPLLAGRSFNSADDMKVGKVVIISKSMAELYWKDPAAAIGQKMSLPPTKYHDMTIVGVAGDVKNLSMDETFGPEMYVPYTQDPYPSMLNMQFALRTNVDPALIAKAIQSAVKIEDPELPIANVRPISDLIQGSMASIRFSVMLLGTFAVIAWILALVGLYSLILYLVSERMRDMAIRVALGATRLDLLSLVFANGARLVTIGLGAGVLLTLAFSRVLTHFVYHVSAADPFSYLVMTALVFMAASAAILVPAIKVMRADPVAVLRAE